MTPLVSVVMAAKNYARFLPEAIASVQAQTFTDWELVIVDDGSQDATPAVVQPHLADPRIRYLRSDRLGISRAKNLGPRFARGEFLALLDADDAWYSHKLEAQLAVMQAQPEVGVCFTRRDLMDEASLRRPANDPPYPTRTTSASIITRGYICYSSVVMRRYLFDMVGGFCPLWDSAVDYDLWMRLSRVTQFAYVDTILTSYRTGHGSVSGKLRDRVETAGRILERWGDRWGHAAELPTGTLTYERAVQQSTLGYLLRDAEPRQAAWHYLRSFPAGWHGAMRGLAACLRGCFRAGNVSAANRSENR
jgi:glycosyltransferase involved in cell wall biosynthesis